MNVKSVFILGLILSFGGSIYADGLPNLREKYAEVFKHYSRTPSDSLKYKAAQFLVENMKYHATTTSEKQRIYYSKLADIEKRYKFPECQPYIYTLADSIRAIGNDSFTQVLDDKFISCQYLIENIDDAFEKWQKGNYAKHLNFSDFCEYLLPYKLTNEHVETWRAALFQQYKRGIESIEPIDDKKYSAYWAASQINDIIKQDKIFIQNVPYVGDVNLPVSVLKDLRMGICNDYAFKAAYIMRACGIPVGVDFTPQWPSRPHGHHWDVVLDNSGKNIPFMGAESNPGYPCKDDYIVGKIYRYTFSVQKQSLYWKNKDIQEKVPGVLNIPYMKDVTNEYAKGARVVVNLKGKNSRKRHFAYLAAFDNQNWIPIAFAEIKNEQAVFDNVGRGAVYLPVIWDGECLPVGYPIKIQENGDVVSMKPSTQQHHTIDLKRKYPVFSRIYSFSKRMNKATFVASSHSEFADKQTVAEISRNPDMQMDSVVANYGGKKCRYLRYVAPKRSHCNVAEFLFYTGKEQIVPLSVKTDGTEEKGFNGSEVLDGKYITYYESKKSDYAYLDFDFGKPVAVTKIKYLPRNDDNFVVPGHVYSLDYYDEKSTKSCAVIKATSNHLTFSNVPEGALLVLHDLTAGTEERIFEYVNGKLIWH